MQSRIRLSPSKYFTSLQKRPRLIGAFVFIFEFKIPRLQSYISFNGSIVDANQPLITADNRGFKYGDGLFETIKVVENNICLAAYHFERLFSSMDILKLERSDFFTAENLTKEILTLCRKNGHHHSARVRLTVFRGNGKLFDLDKYSQNYIVQTEELPDSRFLINQIGLVTDIFPLARKSCDAFSNIKSNNFLIYSMAALYARENELDDCFIMNSYERICESVMANVFCIKDDVIYTPGLSEGCIQGVMRRFLLMRIAEKNILLKETDISVEMIKQADEVFLTNSIFGIRWVKRLREVEYGNRMIREIFNWVFGH